ncbi:hypothetical protein HCU66_08295, partial [Pseudomonas frederiksbergensis]|uniref:glycine-rich domain-containing protein n=1 Tax=Pseudomonas frederiksbergensis TaxID=104087 RepID=UPI003B97956A|nr:hypothetical protein [Pseudomonas frederiksbergensis]
MQKIKAIFTSPYPIQDNINPFQWTFKILQGDIIMLQNRTTSIFDIREPFTPTLKPSLSLLFGLLATSIIIPTHATTAIYNQVGSYSFKAPNGINELKFTVIGSGGGGGGGGGAFDLGAKGRGAGGGGGGGGSSATCTIAVKPGDDLIIVVGAGGLAGNGAP